MLKLPFYAKASLLLIGLYVFFSILFIAQGIILPLIYAFIIASAISPGVAFLTNKKINRTIAIALVLAAVILILGILVAFLSSQVSLLTEAWPQLVEKFQSLFKQSIKGFSTYFNISTQKVNAWVADTRSDFMDNSGTAIGLTLTTMGGVLTTLLLTPVYIFMVLSYQPHLIQFIHKVCGDNNENRVSEILIETRMIIQSYLVGLFSEFGIIAVLNSIGLLILGIDYAILLGIVGALLNVVPYIGGLIGVVLFMMIALVTKSPEYVLYVAGLYTLIQLIDNNYIVPKIVGSKVKLNALVSIIVVIIGAALWGIPGMFLAIPLTAILKLIFDRIDPLKPWGFLMGDTTVSLLQVDLGKITKKLPRMVSRKK
jgi:predicted PurR-regulated permease PerM